MFFNLPSISHNVKHKQVTQFLSKFNRSGFSFSFYEKIIRIFPSTHETIHNWNKFAFGKKLLCVIFLIKLDNSRLRIFTLRAQSDRGKIYLDSKVVKCPSFIHVHALCNDIHSGFFPPGNEK